MTKIFKQFGVAPDSEPERSEWIEAVAVTLFRQRYPGTSALEAHDEHRCKRCGDSGWSFYTNERGYEYAERCSCLSEDVDRSPGKAMGFPSLPVSPKKSDLPSDLWAQLDSVSKGDSVFLYGPADRTLVAGYIAANHIRAKLGVMPKYQSIHRFPSKSAREEYMRWKDEVLSAESVVVDGLCRGCETQSLHRAADLIEEAGRCHPRKTLIILGEALDPDAYPANVWSRINRAMQRVVKVRWRVK